jgi:hypothetical protein
MRGRLQPSASLVVATMALVVAIGGTGYAAFRLPDGSVGTPQLKDGAVTARKVRVHSLLAKDFKPGQLRIGAGSTTGPGTGSPGAAGSTGPPGPPGTARAYGLISSSGTLNTTRSKGITAVSHPAVGIFCIALVSTIAAGTTTVVATPDEGDPSSTDKAVAHINSEAPDCPAGDLEVVMRRFLVDTTVNPPVLAVHHTDAAFSLVVP